MDKATLNLFEKQDVFHRLVSGDFQQLTNIKAVLLESNYLTPSAQKRLEVFYDYAKQLEEKYPELHTEILVAKGKWQTAESFDCQITLWSSHPVCAEQLALYEAKFLPAAYDFQTKVEARYD